MTLSIRPVSFYMAQRKKGLDQNAAAATAGISARSGLRIEKGQWQQHELVEDIAVTDLTQTAFVDEGGIGRNRGCGQVRGPAQ